MNFPIGLVANSFVISDTVNVAEVDLSGLDIYSCYQTMPFCTGEVRQAIFRQRLLEAIACGGFCMVAFDGDQVVAVCAIKPLVWDSSHFGLPMVELLLSSSQTKCSHEGLRRLLQLVIGKLKRGRETCHVSTEVDMDHYHDLNPLLGMGFEVMDVKRYFHATDMEGFQVPRFLSLVREYRPEDYERVMEVAREVDIQSRFSRDRHLSADKTREMYAIWLSKSLGEMGRGSFSFVFERRGKIEGCNVISRQRLSYLQEPVAFMDRGLYVADRRGIGGYAPILYRSIGQALEQDGVVQTCVSLSNGTATRTLERWNTRRHVTAYALRLFLE